MLTVVAREGANLQLLASREESPLKVPCGAIGRIIAEKVLEGNGKATIPWSDIRSSTDTLDGAHAILDNFDLIDAFTGEPLLPFLLRESSLRAEQKLATLQRNNREK